MARCGCGSGGTGTDCNCALVDGNGTTVSGAGTSLAPWQVAVDVDPVAGNLLTTGPNGLAVACESIQDCVGQGMGPGLIYDDAGNQYRARISTAPGNTVTFGPDNGIFSAPGAIALGCGLETGPGGAVQANGVDFATLTRRNCNDTADAPGVVPLPGPDTAGMGVYCDAAGVLRTMPEKFTEVAQSQMNEGFAPAITAFPFTSSPIQIGATNPSAQYCMCGFVQFAALPAISGAAGTVYTILYETDPGSGVFTASAITNIDNRGKTGLSGNNVRAPLLLNVCLDPAETKIIRLQIRIERGVGDNGGAITLSGLAREIRFVGTNL